MTLEEEGRLAIELFALFGARMKQTGLGPEDPMVARVIATMMAAHYRMAGVGREQHDALVYMVDEALDRIDAQTRRPI